MSQAYRLIGVNEMNRAKLITCLVIIVVLAITFINPIYPHDQILQHAGTLLLMIPLVYDLKKGRMPYAAFLGLSLFTILHIIGARYIYSYVPYSEWIVSTGIVDAGFFSGNRNYYDRFVHFMYGFLLFPYIMFLCQKRLRLGDMTAILFSWLIIQTGSMIYELFEWLLTVFMAPEDAESYNGQQGDIWDAQKDMALALIGSTIPAVWYWCKRLFKRE